MQIGCRGVFLALTAIGGAILVAKYEDWTKEMVDPAEVDESAFADFFAQQNYMIPGQAEDMVGITSIALHCSLTIHKDAVLTALPDPTWRAGLFAVHDDEDTTHEGILRINLSTDAVARMSIRLNIQENDSSKMLSQAAPSGVPGHQQIDLLFAEGLSEFIFATASDMVKVFNLKLEKSKSISVNTLYMAANLVSLLRVGRGAYKATSAIDPTSSLVSKRFYGGLPFKSGAGAVKWALFPQQPDQRLSEGRIVTQNNTNLWADDAVVYRKDLFDWLQANGSAKWDFVVQKHIEGFDMDAASAIWDQSLSPFLPVGTLTISAQQTLSINTELNEYIAGDLGGSPAVHTLQFNPWNQLVAHEPLGAMNHARRLVYQAAGKSRRDKAARERDDLSASKPIEARSCPFLNGELVRD